MKTKHASLVKCLRITAYTNRFVQKLKKIPTPKGVPTSDEIQVARKRWIKALQGKHFLHTKNGKTKLNKTTAENFLNLKLDEGGIISCYGRMTNANLPQEKTTPILLPQKEKFVNATKDYHMPESIIHCLDKILDCTWKDRSQKRFEEMQNMS